MIKAYILETGGPCEYYQLGVGDYGLVGEITLCEDYVCLSADTLAVMDDDMGVGVDGLEGLDDMGCDLFELWSVRVGTKGDKVNI